MNRTFFMVIGITIAMFLHTSSVFALSPQIRYDMLKTKLVEQLKGQEYNKALDTITELKSLDITMPSSLDYFEGKALFESGNKYEAYVTLEKYVEKNGKSKYYNKAIAYLVKAEDAYKAEKQKKIAEKQKEAEREEAISAGGITDTVAGMEFVWVPKGCFEMGQGADGKRELIKDIGMEEYKKYYLDGKPQHEVCVDGFYMGKYEVTNVQYQQYKPSHDSGDYKGHPLNNDQQPVVKVSWNEVQSFISWLNHKTGRNYRLPTEAEWEYAARGGTTTTRFWGNNLNQACSYANVLDKSTNFEWSNWMPIHNCDDGQKTTAPVGTYRPNSFGLYDMLGNVHEWCNDRYDSDYYSISPHNNPQGSGTSSDRVSRGGCWNSKPRNVRSAIRNYYSPDTRNICLGFRLVRP